MAHDGILLRLLTFCLPGRSKTSDTPSVTLPESEFRPISEIGLEPATAIGFQARVVGGLDPSLPQGPLTDWLVLSRHVTAFAARRSKGQVLVLDVSGQLFGGLEAVERQVSLLRQRISLAGLSALQVRITVTLNAQTDLTLMSLAVERFRQFGHEVAILSQPSGGGSPKPITWREAAMNRRLRSLAPGQSLPLASIKPGDLVAGDWSDCPTEAHAASLVSLKQTG